MTFEDIVIAWCIIGKQSDKADCILERYGDIGKRGDIAGCILGRQ